MGVGSRQVGPGVEAVTRFSELSRADDGDGFDHVLMQVAWARGVAGGSVESEALGRAFAGVLIQRFHVRAEVVQRSLEVAADVAVAGEAGIGLTASIARRRLSRFSGAHGHLGAWGCGAECFGFRGAGLVAGLDLGLADPVRQVGEAGAEVLGDVLQVGVVLTVQGDTDDVIAARLVGK